MARYSQWMRDAMIGYGHNMTYSKFRYGGSAVQVMEDKGLYLLHSYLLFMFDRPSLSTPKPVKSRPTLTTGNEALWMAFKKYESCTNE